MNRLLSACSLLAVLTTGCSGDGYPQEMHGTLERDRLELVAESHERIVDVLVREGERVRADAVLLRQEAGTMQPRIDQARAALAEAERRLADAVEGPRQREIDEARAALAGAESALETERREFDRVDALVERKLLSASNRDQARSRRDSALASRDQMRARLRLLQEGTRPEQVREAESAVTRARAALAELETSAALYEVRAPRDGWIEALPYELGERPPAGAPVVVMLAEGAPYARIHVPEPLRAGVIAGGKVSVTVDGVEGALDGTVRYISAEAAFTPYYALTQKDRTRLSYLAEVALDDARAASLPVGVPVQVTIATPAAEPR
jgi:HlyD family secretion protein